MISFKQTGDYSKVTSWLTKCKNGVDIKILDKYGKLGVEALSRATPKDTGYTADNWYYEVKYDAYKKRASLIFSNRNIVNHVPIAIILQYGHATGTGGWVEGIDYINPALKPVFDKLAQEGWKELIG